MVMPSPFLGKALRGGHYRNWGHDELCLEWAPYFGNRLHLGPY